MAAPFSRPSEFPRWADVGGGAGITVPSSGKQDQGWSVGDVPTAQAWNWLQLRNYQWARYLDERIGAGGLSTWRQLLMGATSRAYNRCAGDSSNANVVFATQAIGNQIYVLPVLAGQLAKTPASVNGANFGTAENCIVKSNNAGRFVLASRAITTLNTVFYTSDDGGQSWTLRQTLGTAYGPTSLSYANGVWIFTGATAGTDVIYTSGDGVTWTARTNPNATTLYQLGAAHNGSKYILVGTKVLTSNDAQTWTDAGISFFIGGRNPGYCAAFGGKFYAGKGDDVLYSSSDGVTWVAVGLSLGLSINTTAPQCMLAAGGLIAAIASGGTTASGIAITFDSAAANWYGALAAIPGVTGSAQNEQLCSNGRAVWACNTTNDTIQVSGFV